MAIFLQKRKKRNQKNIRHEIISESGLHAKTRTTHRGEKIKTKAKTKTNTEDKYQKYEVKGGEGYRAWLSPNHANIFCSVTIPFLFALPYLYPSSL